MRTTVVAVLLAVAAPVAAQPLPAPEAEASAPRPQAAPEVEAAQPPKTASPDISLRRRPPASVKPSGPPRHTVVSLPIMALSSNAVVIQAERPIAHHLSAAVALGVRDGADGDYQSTTAGVAGELRLWLRRSQRGWFASPRVELAVLHMSALASGELPARSLGTTAVASEGVLGGYRIVLFDHVEITPTIGLIMRHDVPTGRLPAELRFAGTYGISIGWIFD